MSSGRLVVVVNARAGDGRTRGQLDGVGALGPEFEYELVRAEAPELVPAAIRRVAAGAAGVVVFGGDGTLNDALPSLMATDLPVAIFPAGTVNDLAREMRMTSSFADLKRLFLARRFVAQDVLTANGRPFVIYGSLGVGAETSKYIRATRRRYAALRRALPRVQMPLFMVRTILLTSSWRRQVRLSVDGQARTLTTSGIYVAIQEHLGSGVDLGWNRAASPGRFLGLALRPVDRLGVLKVVYDLQRSKRLDAIRDRADIFEAQSMVVESLDGRPMTFVGDGEPLAEGTRIEVRLVPAALRMVRGDA